MTMSKADFIVIAEAVAEAKRTVEYYNPDATEDEKEIADSALKLVTRELATACARQYKGGYGFNRQRFVEACGFPEA